MQVDRGRASVSLCLDLSVHHSHTPASDSEAGSQPGHGVAVCKEDALAGSEAREEARRRIHLDVLLPASPPRDTRAARASAGALALVSGLRLVQGPAAPDPITRFLTYTHGHLSILALRRPLHCAAAREVHNLHRRRRHKHPRAVRQKLCGAFRSAQKPVMVWACCRIVI